MVKVLRKISDNVVLYAGNELTVDADGAHAPGWFYPLLNNTNAEVVEAVDLPANFCRGGYSYDGSWSVADQSRIDARIAKKNAAANERAVLEDERQVIDSLKKIAILQYALIDVLLAKSTITAGDFDAKSRAVYQNLKPVIDRLRSNLP